MSDRDPQLRFRVPEEMKADVERVAEEMGVSRSEVCRELLNRGMADLGVDGLEHVSREAHREQIIQEELPAKREAWFRSNVGGRLLKMRNSGLTPQEASQDLRSYRRVALETYDRADLAEYVMDGLEAYEASYPRNKPHLTRWVKERLPEGVDDVDNLPTGAEIETEEVETDAPAVRDADPITYSVEESAEVWAGMIRNNTRSRSDVENIDTEDVENVDGTPEDLKAAIWDRLEGGRPGEGE
jgi:antitoxin component of RelBE/YafQ-DinJ toxin-antitoxin module